MPTITCFFLGNNAENQSQFLNLLTASNLVSEIYVLTSQSDAVVTNQGVSYQRVDKVMSSATMKWIAEQTTSEYALIISRDTTILPGQFLLERMLNVAIDTQAGFVYSDYHTLKEGSMCAHPVNDYQQGSVRDDFDFGAIQLINAEVLRQAVGNITDSYQFAGWYDLRLKISQRAELVHLNELLYTEVAKDLRKSGEKQFDYVDPKNRSVQIEMELACTSHLKQIGAWLPAEFEEVSLINPGFEKEASVIIPVKNRVRTIADAVRSIQMQKTEFQFNIIIVDNYSDDGTTELLSAMADGDDRILHLIPERKDLGIGGCWNVAVQHPLCGKFSVQLDSDDVYQDEYTLQKLVDAFYAQNCAMVVGSYTMTNFSMEMIPPGLIDHREWTEENGRNNALRINGLGAPRAFYTPLLRQIKVPNTSYGEDYALGLAISRKYRIGRVYESVYLCRRWEENSDASLDIAKQNAHNAYKDKLRSIEISARQNINKKKSLDS